MEVNDYIRLYESVASDRGPYEQLWKEIAASIYPRRAFFYGGPKHRADYTKVYDSTPLWSQGLLAAYIHTMLTNPVVIWFNVGTVQPEGQDSWEIKRWSQQVDAILYSLLLNSNFHTEIHENYTDLNCMGNTGLWVDEHKERFINFSARPLSNLMWTIGEDGMPNEFYRKLFVSPMWMAEKFGKDALSEDARKKCDDPKAYNLRSFNVIHIVRKREEYIPGAWEQTKRKWASVYIELEHKHQLEVSGYHEQPCSVCRFYCEAEEAIGYGPGEIALPDARSLHMMQKHTLRAVQKATDPPLLLPHRAFVNALDLSAGALNYYNKTGNAVMRGNASFVQPFPQGTQFPAVFEEKNQLRENIMRDFFVDQLRVREADRMTAAEIAQRAAENQRTFAPILGRAGNELLVPALKRVYNIAARRGLLPAPPASVQKYGGLTIRVTGPLARAQAVSDVQALMSAMDTVTPLANVKPRILDMVDETRFMQFVFKSFGAPLNVLHDPTEFINALAEEKKKQEQMQAAAMQAQSAQAMSGSIKDIASATKDLGGLERISGLAGLQ